MNKLRVDILLEQERCAGVPEVVEGYLGQTRTLKERREGSLTEVGGVEEASASARKHEIPILVQGTGP